MKKILLIICLLFSFSVGVFADKYIKGYTRKDGTYTTGHYKTNSNHTVKDNYSYKGNKNPYTGKTGTDYYKKNKSSDYYTGW